MTNTTSTLARLTLFISILVMSAACTFQTNTSGQTAEPTSIPTSPPTLPEGTETISGTPENETGGEEVQATTPLSTGEAPVPTEGDQTEPTGIPEDPFANTDPQGQRVFLWYFLPAQSPADQTFNQVVDLFNQSNTQGIFIDAYNQSTTTGVLTRTLPVLNTSDVPGLIMTTPDMAAVLDEGLQDLTPFIYSPTWGFSAEQLADFSAAMISQSQLPFYTDVQLAFPLLREAQLLFSNTEWITELGYVRSPESTQEIQALACQARDTGMRRTGSLGQTGLQIEPGLASLAALVQAFGGELSGPDSATYVLNSDEAVAAMQYLQGLAFENCASLALEEPELYNSFAQGKSALLLASSEYLTPIENSVESDLAFVWDAVGFFDPEGTETPVIPPGLNFSLPASSPEQMVAAWNFVRFFHTPEAQALWLPASGGMPISPALAQTAEMPDPYSGVLRALDQSYVLPAFPQYTEIDQLVAQAMMAIVEGAAIETRLDSLQNQVDRLTESFYEQR